jgi:hypothetical protein
VLPETQPIAPIEVSTTSSPSIAGQLRLLPGTQKNSSSARAAPPAEGQSSFLVRFSAVVAAVVYTVSVADSEVAPLKVNDVGERLQVAGSTADCGSTMQLRLIVPVNPLDGVTLIVAVFPDVAPGLIVSADPLNVKPGGVVTVTATVVNAVRLPEVPLMVTATGPAAAAPLAAVSVRTCVPGLAPLAKLAVTQLGRPDAVSATFPTNPPRSVTEIVLVTLLP